MLASYYFAAIAAIAAPVSLDDTQYLSIQSAFSQLLPGHVPRWPTLNPGP